MDIYTWFIIGLVVAGFVAFLFFYITSLFDNHSRKKRVKGMKNESVLQQSEDAAPQRMQSLHTKELVLKTLRAIGCSPSVNDEDKDQIEFEYQGGSFSIIAFDSNVFAYLFFVWWYDAPLDNIDALAAIQKAVNKANCRYIGCSVMYTIKQDENLVGVHSRSQLLFAPEVPDLGDYLVSKLQEMFRVRYDVVHDIQNELQ